MLGVFTAGDLAVLIPLFFTSLGAFIIGIINAFQNKDQKSAIADVHTAVDGATHALAASNAATVSTLTETIKAQANPPS